MIVRTDKAVLLLVDLQERMLNAIGRHERNRVVKNAEILMAAAEVLAIPVLATEQYPEGLGSTVAPLAERLDGERVHAKTSFSCCAEDSFLHALQGMGRSQVLLAGVEAHICVLQTAFDLQARGYTPFVLEDAVASRDQMHMDNALARLRHGGVIISNVESALFECLQDASHQQFKSISTLIR